MKTKFITIDNSKNNHIVKVGVTEYFFSYETLIATRNVNTNKVTLDIQHWDYSVTTSKYRNMFLRETTKETQAKINSKEYKLKELN